MHFRDFSVYISLLVLGLVSGCGGGGSSEGASNNAVAAPVVGSQMGGARQGIQLVLGNNVTTFAGPNNATCTSNGGYCPIASTDGVGSSARFRGPWGITTDGSNLYVVDNNGNAIRRVVIATGQVSTIVGTANTIGGFQDGTGAAAQLYLPTGIATDGENLFVADSGNHSIRKVQISSGVVTTLAGPDNATCQANAAICPSGIADGIGSSARFNKPSGITTDGTNLYVTDLSNNTIRKIVIATREVSTLAGTTGLAFGGFADGVGTAAKFFKPYGVVTDGSNLYVADTGNHTIRQISLGNQQVSTIAGSPGLFGFTDGLGAAARFNNPSQLTTDGSYLYIADNVNYTIRKMNIASGQVVTLAGGVKANGYADGGGSAARFSSFVGFGLTTDGKALFISDTGNHTIRKME